jgi:glycosidase
MPRFSYGVNGDIAKLKIGAALNLLLGGIPSIYYGQELGMTGTSAKLGATDANEIPDREAFEWYKSDKGKGMAFWYKEKGPWKFQFNDDKPDDGISLEEEREDPYSLWNFYREMISLRRSHPVLISGIYKTLDNNNDKIYSFQRSEGPKKVVVAVNLSQKVEKVAIKLTGREKSLTRIHGVVKAAIDSSAVKVNMPPYGVEVWSVK